MDVRERPSRVVYRALLGAYEDLREEPVAAASNVDFVCFTDDPDLTSETWRTVLVEPRFPFDAIRSSRYLKIMGHPVLEEYDEWLWVDNTVELLVPPEKILDDWLADADLAVPLHSERSTVLAEAETVLDLGRDDYVRVYEQLATYLRHHPDRVEENPHWNGMVARRRTPDVAAAMSAWWEHVLRFSHRDQLSFAVTVPHRGLRMRSVELDHFASPIHRWPRATGRTGDRPGARLRAALQPPVLEIERLRRVLADTESAIEQQQQAAEHAEHHVELRAALDRVGELETEVAVLHGRLQEATTLVDRLLRQVSRLRHRLARHRTDQS